jgi:hypothetical protein
MRCARSLNVVGAIQNRVDEIRASWSSRERARRAADAERRISWLASVLGIGGGELSPLAVGALCREDLVRMAR